MVPVTVSDKAKKYAFTVAELLYLYRCIHKCRPDIYNGTYLWYKKADCCDLQFCQIFVHANPVLCKITLYGEKQNSLDNTSVTVNITEKHIRLALELKPRRYKSAADAVENGGGDGLRLISYVGGIAMCNRSAIAAMTPPMLSAALADSVSTTDTYHKHLNNSHYMSSRIM